jgi:MioC protein
MFDSFVSRSKVPPHLRSVRRKSRTHDYSLFVWGDDYIFEPIEEGSRGYMTGRGQGIEGGDCLILSNGFDSCRYRVEKINYYSNPPDMWIALLKLADRNWQV